MEAAAELVAAVVEMVAAAEDPADGDAVAKARREAVCVLQVKERGNERKRRRLSRRRRRCRSIEKKKKKKKKKVGRLLLSIGGIHRLLFLL